jgi:hypothetical protein
MNFINKEYQKVLEDFFIFLENFIWTGFLKFITSADYLLIFI